MDNPIFLSDINQTDSRDFQCHICQKYFSRKFTLDMHLLIHKGIKPHTCPFCGKCFRQKGTLMRHKALHSTNNLFHCSLCNRGFRQKNVFLHHLKHRHNVSTEALDRRKYRTQLKDYQSIMDTLPPFVLADSTAIASSEKHLDAMLFETLSNNICDSSVSEGLLDSIQSNCINNLIALREDNLECHTQDCVASNGRNTSSNHVCKEIKYKCDLCLKVFAGYTKYKQHIKQLHNNDDKLLDSKPIICTLSPESIKNTLNSSGLSSLKELASDTNLISPSYAKQIVLKNRTNTVSNSNETVSNGQINFCIPCQMSYANEEEFKFHLKTHVQSVLGESNVSSLKKGSDDFKLTNSVPMTTKSCCDILSGDNSSYNNLPTLLSISSTSSYLNQESKVSKSKVLDKKQGKAMLYSVSPKFHDALYKCKLCNKIFQDKLTFEYHKQLHLSIRGFDCGYCRRKFASKQLLLSHTRSKHLKTFKCASCSRSFNYRSIYICHEKNCNKNTRNGVKSIFNFPLIDIQKLLNSDTTGISGIIPICDSSISKNSIFKIGIPVVSIEAIRDLSKIPFLNSFEINGALKKDV